MIRNQNPIMPCVRGGQVGILMAVAMAVCSGLPVRSAELLFKTGFEPEVRFEDYRQFRGKDLGTGFDYDKISQLIPHVSSFGFKYWGGRCPEDAYVEIISDPEGKRGQILHAQVNSDSGGGVRCRTEGSLNFHEPFDQICVRYQYKISEAYQAVLENRVKGWWLISELWSEGAETDRASLPLYLERGDNFFWFRQTLRAKSGNSFTTLWEAKNERFAVPLGRWVDVVHLVKPGPAGTGRMVFIMDGETVLDILDQPIVWGNRRWKYWSCLKLYEGVGVTDFLRKRGTPAQVWYDDFEVWSDLPATPALNRSGGLPIVMVKANTFEDSDVGRFPPIHVRDGSFDRNSTWRAESEHGRNPWIACDLGQRQEIGSVRIAFMQTAPRTFTFSVETVDGPDGPWIRRLDHVTSTEGKSDLETFKLNPVKARYLRVVGHGGSHSTFPTWTCISELEVH
jgi:hypothetical protein